MIRTVFFGTPEFAVPFLNALANDPSFDVVSVVTRPDEEAGRGHALTAPPVRVAAEASGIPVYQPATLKSDEALKMLSDMRADVFVVFAYGRIIPKAVLELPRLGCVNVHPSLLPKYRGPTPIQSAIAKGDKETGVSIMLLDKGMDTGPILAQEKIILAADETQGSLTEKIKQLGPALLIETIKKYVASKIEPQPQDDSQAVICKMLSRDAGKIDWSESAERIEQKIRAYFPWPGTWTEFSHNGKNIRVKILKAKLNNGQLELLEVQPEGGAVMPYEAFVRGYGKLN